MSDGSGSEGETYEVEKILDKKIVKGKTQYFIKWKGELKYFLQILQEEFGEIFQIGIKYGYFF